jgi:pre-mRNA-splicing factor SPF27
MRFCGCIEETKSRLLLGPNNPNQSTTRRLSAGTPRSIKKTSQPSLHHPPQTSTAIRNTTPPPSPGPTLRMPLTNAIHDSLPYIDPEPTASQRAAAQALIASEAQLDAQPADTHPSMPALLPSQLSPLMTLEMERLSADPKSKLKAIDLSRYEALSAPTSTTDMAAWKAALQSSYTAQTYLSARSTSLALLETYGKNAWLISNSQLEAILRSYEQDLAATKTEIDHVVIERKTAQDAVGGEITGLEETWKRGVGRVLETEVAAESVRGEILERRRAGAV